MWLYSHRAEADLSGVLGQRLHTAVVNYLLAIGGLAITAVLAAIHDRLRPSAWVSWAMGLGMFGAVLSAVQGLWNATRYPALKAAWDTGNEIYRMSVELALATPNAADPRGLASQLLLGACLIVFGWRMLGDGWPRWLGQLAIVEGVVLGLVFVAGLADLPVARTVLAAVGIGALGPVWWSMAALELWRGPAT